MTTSQTAPAGPQGAVPDLTGLMVHAARMLNTRISAALDEIGTGFRMHCVLAHALEEERTQIQIAELSDMDKTTMVATVDALERAGLAERRPAPWDRRARIVAVTEKGAELAGRGAAIVDRVHQELLDALPADEARAFASALVRLNEGYLAHPAESSRPVRRARAVRRD